jgi:hypothetical protein
VTIVKNITGLNKNLLYDRALKLSQSPENDDNKNEEE